MAYNYYSLVEEIDRLLLVNPRTGLAELVLALQVDRHTVSAALKHVRGATFSRYRRDKLLRKALSLLTRDSAATVKEISFALLFKSPQAFARFVKVNTGLTPTQIVRDRSRMT
jgi:AraC-like DNA-binding protein